MLLQVTNPQTKEMIYFQAFEKSNDLDKIVKFLKGKPPGEERHTFVVDAGKTTVYKTLAYNHVELIVLLNGTTPTTPAVPLKNKVPKYLYDRDEDGYATRRRLNPAYVAIAVT